MFYEKEEKYRCDCAKKCPIPFGKDEGQCPHKDLHAPVTGYGTMEYGETLKNYRTGETEKIIKKRKNDCRMRMLCCMNPDLPFATCKEVKE